MSNVLAKKKWLITLMTAMLSGGLVACILWQKQRAVITYNDHNLIRIHVLANSDSESDQAVKLLIKDRVVELLSPVLSGVGDRNKAAEIIQDNIDRIKKTAQDVLRREGFDYPVKVSLGNGSFPQCTYSLARDKRLKVPPGNYKALKIELGRAAGHNWWCVLFPPLCLAGVTSPVISPAMLSTPVNIQFHFKLLELFREAINGLF